MLNEFLRKLFPELGIYTDPETLSVDQAFDLVRPRIAPIKDMFVDKAVADGVAAGKLAPHEIDWAKAKAAEWGLECFQAFIAKREKVSTGTTGPKTIETDDLQRSINAQLAVSDELFGKYNSNAKKSAKPKIPIGDRVVNYRRVDTVEQEMRRKLQIPRKVWDHYYPDEEY